MIFHDRTEAGRELVHELLQYSGMPDVVVLGLPRGGVVVAYEIAKALKLTMDIIVPRKIGAPGNPEFAIGAITEDGEGVFSQDVINNYQIGWDYIEREVARQMREARRRIRVYRSGRPPLDLSDKIVIIVDDGIATIGITDYAQGELGDIVFVELPSIGDKAEQSKPCASIEAVKAVSDLFAPVSGEIVQVNSSLESDPSLINQSPYDTG